MKLNLIQSKNSTVWLGAFLAVMSGWNANCHASPPNLKKAVYTPASISIGGETGNGGDAQVAALVAEIAIRAASQVRALCQNHPEIRSEKPCGEVEAFSSTLGQTAWIPAEQVFICAGGTVVLGGLPETSLALAHFGPCTERDAVNFGQVRDRHGKQVIVISRSRYAVHFDHLQAYGRRLLQNILHETLSLMNADQSDSYSSSVQWIEFLAHRSRLSVIYNSDESPSLVSLYLKSDLSESNEQGVYAIVAQHRYVRAASLEKALYTLSLKREVVSASTLPDGSMDITFTATLQRNSDQGYSQVVSTHTIRYNSLKPTGELPSSVRAQLDHWLSSSNFPEGML